MEHSQMEIYQVDEHADIVPTKKIQVLKIEDVSLAQQKNKNGQVCFQIQVFRKQEGPNYNKNTFKIIRSKKDLQWLATSVIAQQKWFAIVPILKFSQNWADYLSTFISKSSQDSIQSTFKKKQDVQVVKRFLQIISYITVKYLYRNPAEDGTPLFIFFQQSQALFDYYKKMYTIKQADQGGVQISNYVNDWFNYSKNVFKVYIPNISRKNSHTKPLQECKVNFQLIKSQGLKLENKISNYQQQLKILQQNFIQHRVVIKDKINNITILLMRIKVKNNISALIFFEIQKVIEYYSKFSEKQPYMIQQVGLYIEHLNKELKQIYLALRKICIEFTDINKQKNLHKINISDLYYDFKTQKNDHKK